MIELAAAISLPVSRGIDVPGRRRVNCREEIRLVFASAPLGKFFSGRGRVV
jgi:hypothetical protein